MIQSSFQRVCARKLSDTMIYIFSHDLQTCDWPRNVGCVSSASAAGPLNNANSVNTAPGNEELSLRQTTPSWKHEALQPQQDEIPDVSALLNYSNAILLYGLFNRFIRDDIRAYLTYFMNSYRYECELGLRIRVRSFTKINTVFCSIMRYLLGTAYSYEILIVIVSTCPVQLRVS